MAAILAAGLLLRPQQNAAAVPTLRDVKSGSETERIVLERVHKGLEADLTRVKNRHLDAVFLSTLIFSTAASAVPSKLISITGAIIDGPLSVPTGSSPVPHNIVLNNCTFQQHVEFTSARFEQSIFFINVLFREGISLDLAQIKGDLIFREGSIRTEDPERSSNLNSRADQLSMNHLQVDGEIQLTGVHVESVVGEYVRGKDVRVTLDDVPIDDLVLPQLDTASFSIRRPFRGRTEQSPTRRASSSERFEVKIRPTRIRS